MIARDAVTDEQAEAQLHDLKEREAVLREELDKLAEMLQNVPTQEAVRRYVEKVNDSIFVYDDNGEVHPGGNSIGTFLTMTREEHRNLVRAVFAAPLGDGTPAGIYVFEEGKASPHRPKRWSFKIRGRLEFELVMQSVRG